VNRKLTARERWFLTAAPAITVLAVYGFAFYGPGQANLARAQQGLVAARRVSVTQGEVDAKRQAARSAQARLDGARLEVSGNPAGGTGLRVLAGTGSKGCAACDESRALAKITDVLKVRNILVVASTRTADSGAGNLMPAGLGEAIKGVAGTAKGAGHGGVWRMDLVGNFDDMRTSLSAIDALTVLVVPLSISMEPSQDGGPLHRWSLWVWM
jgi:hypothetical protein